MQNFNCPHPLVNHLQPGPKELHCFFQCLDVKRKLQATGKISID